MHPVALIFGFACLGAILLAKSVSARLVAWMCLECWAGANVLHVLDTPDLPVMDLLAVLDLPVAALGFIVWYEGHRPWQAWFALLFGARLPLHVFAGTGLIDWVWYLHTVNALFLAALVSVASGGIRDVVADICLSFIRWRDRRVAAFAFAHTRKAHR